MYMRAFEAVRHFIHISLNSHLHTVKQKVILLNAVLKKKILPAPHPPALRLEFSNTCWKIKFKFWLATNLSNLFGEEFDLNKKGCSIFENSDPVQWNLSLGDHWHDWETTCLYRPHILASEPTFQYNWTCHQRPPLLTNHIFVANGVVFQNRFYCGAFYETSYTEKSKAVASVKTYHCTASCACTPNAPVVYRATSNSVCIWLAAYGTVFSPIPRLLAFSWGILIWWILLIGGQGVPVSSSAIYNSGTDLWHFITIIANCCRSDSNKEGSWGTKTF